MKDRFEKYDIVDCRDCGGLFLIGDSGNILFPTPPEVYGITFEIKKVLCSKCCNHIKADKINIIKNGGNDFMIEIPYNKLLQDEKDIINSFDALDNMSFYKFGGTRILLKREWEYLDGSLIYDFNDYDNDDNKAE